MANHRLHVFRNLLDASGLAASGMGALWSRDCNAAYWYFELLDERLLEFFHRRIWWRVGVGRFAAHQKTSANQGCGLMWFGLTILASSRPFEGLLLAILVGSALLFWMIGRKSSGIQNCGCKIPGANFLFVDSSRCCDGLLLLQVIGTPFRLTYQADIHLQSLPAFFGSPRSRTCYRHAVLRHFMSQTGVTTTNIALFAVFFCSIKRSFEMWAFLFASSDHIPLLTLPWLWRDRRMRFP